MPTNILMPALSPTMEKGNLAKWLKKEGDKVRSGDVLAEIETDKATMEVEAVDEGTLGRILVAEGTQDVPVNEPIAVLLGEGEEAGAAPAPAPKAEAPAAKSEAVAPKQAAPAPAKKAEAPGPAAPAKPAEPAPAAAPEKTNGAGRVFASPLARRLAKDAGIALSAVTGSGPHGRIVKRDIEEAQAKGVAAPQPAAARAPAPAGAPMQGPSDDQIRAFYEEGSYEVVPHDSMRKTIARRMQQSKVVVPHYYLSVDVDLDALLKLREELNASAPQKDGKPEWKISVNDMIIKALALALMKHPQANSTWTETGMLRHKHVDIGVAVAIPGGLITPIVRRAEEKSLKTISLEMVDLAKRAREKKLKPMEYEGGTTAISNLGMFGVKSFTAVVNPPHSTILAVAAGEKRAVVRDDAVAIVTQMTATLSCDHRVLNGVESAETMQTFKRIVEKPLSLVV
jgi:pyruvate dehydrogenase E2 component (dihydrolipoamide acetyltransferase)